MSDNVNPKVIAQGFIGLATYVGTNADNEAPALRKLAVAAVQSLNPMGATSAREAGQRTGAVLMLLVPASAAVSAVKDISNVGAVTDSVIAGSEASEELSGIQLAKKLGAEGEAEGTSKGRIESLTGKANRRFPDILLPKLKYIGEIKNVKILRTSSQMYDYIAFAKYNGWGPVFYIVRDSTQLAPAVQKFVNAGDIVIARSIK